MDGMKEGRMEEWMDGMKEWEDVWKDERKAG